MCLRSTKAILRMFAIVLGATLGVLGGAEPSDAMAQNLAMASGGPRFLYTSAKTAHPVEIDARQMAVLRRRVSLKLDRPTVGSLLAAIGRQTGLEFLYSREDVPVDRPIGLRAESITVAAALTEILVDTGIDVLLSPGRQVVLVERGKIGAELRRGAIVGRVTDTTGHALAQVEVLLNGTTWHTETDTVGHYRLTGVDAGTYTLVARRVGYTKWSQRVTVGDREDTVNVVLSAAAVKLDELVTTATGQQRRRDLGNDITTINADSVLKSAPIRNLADLLVNRVPGLTAHHTSGAPGDPTKLRLEGLGSALRSNDPVVIVDGVRIFADQSSARAGNLTNLDPSGQRANPVDVPAPSPLDQIDPNMIEKIEVFKGPSAATLYGADAANGVIVVTTKRGKAGPTRWTASLTQSRTTTPGQYPTGYYRWGHDVLLGSPAFCTILDALCAPDSLVQFQALNDPTLTVLGHGHSTDLSLGASGGTQALTYAITGSFGTETGLLTLPQFEVERFRATFNQNAPDWMQHPHQLKTWHVSSNVTARLGATADVTLSASVSREEQQRSQLESQVAQLAATYIDTVNGIYYQTKRSAYPGGDAGGGGVTAYGLEQTSTVLSSYYTRQTASAIAFTTGLNANWHPRPWFIANGTLGLNVQPRDDQLLLPSGLVAITDSGAVVHGTGRALQSTATFNGLFTKPLGHGFSFQTSIGGDVTTQNQTVLVSSARGLVPGTSSITGAQRFTATESGIRTSIFGWYIDPRIVSQRLAISIGMRLNGGSAYGANAVGNGGGLFGLLGLPKLGASWVVSEEPWFPFRGVFNSLRLRGAYGRAQREPDPADRLRLYTGSPNTGGLLYLTTVGNRGLRPERSQELSGGFDADLLDNRLSLEASLYRKMTIDALMNYQLPGSVNGGGSILQNIGNIRNRGINLVARVTPIRMPALTWSAELNYNANNNILTKLGPGVLASKQQGLVEGYPLYSRWTRPILDFVDVNGDGVLQTNEIQVGDSLVYVGRLDPAYQSSLFTNVVLFGGAIGITAGFDYNHGASQINEMVKQNWVLARALVDPSTPLDQQAAVVASTNGRYSLGTDYGLIEQVSTFRFNSLSINYRVPITVARRLGAQQMGIAVQGANLGLHSTYHGLDPDVSAWVPGENIIDTGQLPQPRRWQLRVDLGY